jgi:addiction module HigA family antidote
MTPGDLLAIVLRDQSATQQDLATAMGRPAQMVSEIRTGHKRVTVATALQLEAATRVPARVWLVLQMESDLAEEEA